MVRKGARREPFANYSDAAQGNDTREKRDNNMIVNVYAVDKMNDETLAVANVMLVSCFPSDPDEMTRVATQLREHGEAYSGGGALQLFRLQVATILNSGGNE
jgi:hypothetical protein